MKTEEINRKLEEHILSFKGIHTEEQHGGKVFYLVSKPFAAIFSETIEIKAKNDYNETIRILHDEISEGKIMGKDWNEIRYSENLPFEVISDMADRGYRMTYASLPKKVQREIEEYYHG
ncbi:MAG: hypothetical protein IJX15_04040 [Ruminiclostridium sp.]|nr:hypothetical protein [Ruminiclostridium sp.]MBQ8841275.1 hypothetical protein [Ruminiclostridium sp.]